MPKTKRPNDPSDDKANWKRAEKALEWSIDEAERAIKDAGLKIHGDVRNAWIDHYKDMYFKAIDEKKRLWEKDGRVVLARARLIGAHAAALAVVDDPPDAKDPVDPNDPEVKVRHAKKASEKLDCNPPRTVATAAEQRLQRMKDRAKWCEG